MKRRVVFLVLILCLGACSERPAATPVVASQPAVATQPIDDKSIPEGITSNEAIAIVSELPEIKAWGKYITEQSKGEARAAMMVMPPKPEAMEGKYYWSVNYYENQPTHFHRWQTFMVRLDGKEILVDNVVTGEFQNLAVWREKEKPMERVRDKNAP